MHKILVVSLEGRDHLQDPDVNTWIGYWGNSECILQAQYTLQQLDFVNTAMDIQFP
jgi:hypothetical protein